MSEFKPGDKVYIIAEYISDETDCVRVNIKTYRQPEYGVDMFIPLSLIHSNPTEELERLRAYVELQPCFCQRGLVKLCDRCLALGKEKS